jgi:hypothetical protein
MPPSPLISRSALTDADPQDPVDQALTLAIETFTHLQATGATPTGGQRTLQRVNWVMISQPNGGLDMTVVDAPHAIGELADALAAVGAEVQARLLTIAAEQVAADAEADLSALDDDWFERDLEGDLAARLVAFATGHPGEFFSD